MNRTVLCLAAVVVAVVSWASLPMARGLPTDAPDSGNVVSPEVGADRRGTFRLKAPGASVVRIVGDFALNGTPMTKGENGVWTFTTPVLPTAIWGYTFNVDG